MARIGATIGVTNSKLGSYSFTGPATAVDALAASTLAAAQATLTTDIAAMGTLQTTFEAALAVLVADGASPTQAHVTTANNAYTALETGIDLVQTDITALQATFGVAPSTTDVVLSVDLVKVPSISCLEIALQQLLNGLSGTSYFTP